MKSILTSILLIISLVILSCADKQAYKIIGEISNPAYEGKTIYLSTINSIEVDSSIILKGKFTFKGKSDKPEIKTIKIPPVWPQFMEELLVIVEPGKINASIGTKSKGEGTQLNDSFQNWKELKLENDSLKLILFNLQHEFKVNENFSKLDSIQLKIDEADNDFVSKTTQIILNNSQNILGQYLFKLYYSKIDFEKKVKILSSASEVFLNDDMVNRILKDLSLKSNTLKQIKPKTID